MATWEIQESVVHYDPLAIYRQKRPRQTPCKKKTSEVYKATKLWKDVTCSECRKHHVRLKALYAKSGLVDEEIADSIVMEKPVMPRWRWKHVPTGLYWTFKHKVPKGIFFVWSNLNSVGKSFTKRPQYSMVTMYYHPDDQIDLKVSAPKRVSMPGEWVLEEGSKHTDDLKNK